MDFFVWYEQLMAAYWTSGWLASWSPILLPVCAWYLLAMMMMYFGIDQDDDDFLFRTERRIAICAIFWPLFVVGLLIGIIGWMVVMLLRIILVAIFGTTFKGILK